MSNKTNLDSKHKKEMGLNVFQKSVNQLHSDIKTISEQQLIEKDLQKFQVFLPKVVHKKIKSYCIQADLNMKDFTTDAIIEQAKKIGII